MKVTNERTREMERRCNGFLSLPELVPEEVKLFLCSECVSTGSHADDRFVCMCRLLSVNALVFKGTL